MRRTANSRTNRLVTAFTSALVVSSATLLTPQCALACGGFFCALVPIDQAGEQIIFRQDGDDVTAVVLIQYVGEAQDFSWVIPVPGIPTLSPGSDLVFPALELATRPAFNVEQIGGCADFPDFCFPACPQSSPGGADNDNADGGGGVDVLQRLNVGPFDIQIVASEDPDALATWLVDNGYDLSDRGRDLIAPYVAEGMNFVAVRLQQNLGVGDIRPLIMKYKTTNPTIPIRLTAVAAQPDMGVLVWILGPSRAVPLNYLHVTPNYTLLNWYQGTQNAYADYQRLITVAMDEAGGQGFATDYAGPAANVNSLSPIDFLTDELLYLTAIEDDSNFVAAVATDFVFPANQTIEILHRALPLPTGDGDYVYQIPELLRAKFDAAQLAAARTQIIVDLNDTIIQPYANTIAVFDGVPYLTRLYTTLSADEMTLDPSFSFNAGMPQQALTRKATLDVDCGVGWSLTLGEGTGREGERVIEGAGDPPSFFTNVPLIAQDAIYLTEQTSAEAAPVVVTQKQFSIARVGETVGGGEPTTLCGNGSALCGSGSAIALLTSLCGLRCMRRQR